MVLRKVSGITIKSRQEQADTVLLERKKSYLHTARFAFNVPFVQSQTSHPGDSQVHFWIALLNLSDTWGARCSSVDLLLCWPDLLSREMISQLHKIISSTKERISHGQMELLHHLWSLTKQACKAQAIAIKTPGNLLLTYPSSEDALSQWQLLLSEQAAIICLPEVLQTTNWGGFDTFKGLIMLLCPWQAVSWLSHLHPRTLPLQGLPGTRQPARSPHPKVFGKKVTFLEVACLEPRRGQGH